MKLRMSDASIETTLEVWVASLRDIKAPLWLLFTQAWVFGMVI